ncbi:hypothetical protein RJ639_014450 [Escallonia herrerae]|uniref:P-type ATPase A domain-containing protein n=1 Tax=Escallonia herrerae TaxID=1293975 RepID=A0AA89AP19_9ASTE|nr:hypothetical protein RJ639_014450 [Escallonia herrerae]
MLNVAMKLLPLKLVDGNIITAEHSMLNFAMKLLPLNWLTVILMLSFVSTLRCGCHANGQDMNRINCSERLLGSWHNSLIYCSRMAGVKASHKRCMQATALMSSLVNIVTQKALLATTEAVDADEVIDVKSGEIIPVNGIVVEGNCEVDEKTLMEESFPEAKQIDSNVWAGTTNHSGELNNFVFLLPRDTLNEGYVTVKTTALAEDRVVARMAKLVEETQNNKSKTQKLME